MYRMDLAADAEVDAAPSGRSFSSNSFPLPPPRHPPPSPLPLTYRPPPLIPGYSRRWGLVCLNLVQDSRAVRSYALFIVSVCTFTAVFLATEAAVVDLTATCGSLRVVDLSRLPDTCPDALPDYNAYISAFHWNRWLLLASLVICMYGNSVYHRRAAAALVLSVAMQLVVLVRYGADDLAFCAWDKLTSTVSDCVSSSGHALPAELTPCQLTAVEQCQRSMGLEFFAVSLFSLLLYLSIIAVICLSLYALISALKQAVQQSVRMRQRLEAALPPLSHPLLLSVYTDRHQSLEALWSWCERRLYLPLFATDEQHRWMQDMQSEGLTEVVQSISISQSLRVSFALTFATVVNTALVVALVLTCISYWSEPSRCLLVAGLLTYLHIGLLIVIHLSALRTHIRHRLHRLIRAERRGDLRAVLDHTKVRWWNLPFYCGSLFGALLWTYVLVCSLLSVLFLSLSNEQVKGVLWQYRLPLFRTLLYPICLILGFRFLAGYVTFHRCLFNLPTRITRRPRHPRLFLALDAVGLFVGSWSSLAHILLRLLATLLLAMGRIDVPTSSLDLPYQQFLSVVEVEAWRLWRDWKRRERGVDIWRKDGEWEVEEREEEEREAEEEERRERAEQRREREGERERWREEQRQRPQQEVSMVINGPAFDGRVGSCRRPVRRWSSGDAAVVDARRGGWPG